jgi:hypothetical protein
MNAMAGDIAQVPNATTETAGASLRRALMVGLALFFAAELFDLATALMVPPSTLAQIEVDPFMLDLMGPMGVLGAAVSLKLVMGSMAMVACAFVWHCFGRASKMAVVATLLLAAAVAAAAACSNIVYGGLIR